VKLYTALRLDDQQVALLPSRSWHAGEIRRKRGWRGSGPSLQGWHLAVAFKITCWTRTATLMQHYADGDRVYIFGFSRGAYTARALAGLLARIWAALPRQRGPYSLRLAHVYPEDRNPKGAERAYHLDGHHISGHVFPIGISRFISLGLWDTVSSVG